MKRAAKRAKIGKGKQQIPPVSDVDEEAVPEWAGVKEIAWHRHKNMALRLVRLPCGKSNCGCCPHGPYWYLVIWRGSRPMQWYIGVKLFGARIKRFPDREALIVRIVNECKIDVSAEQRDYIPDGIDLERIADGGIGTAGEA